MLARIKSLLSAPPESQQDQQQLQTAAAALLIEVMVVDGDLAETEQQMTKDLLQQLFGLESELLTNLFEEAQREVDSATSLYQFTRQINEQYTPDQKFDLLVAMWRVAYADQHVDKYEEHIIRRIADLLHMRHSEFIQAKQLAKPLA